MGYCTFPDGSELPGPGVLLCSGFSGQVQGSRCFLQRQGTHLPPSLVSGHADGTDKGEATMVRLIQRRGRSCPPETCGIKPSLESSVNRDPKVLGQRADASTTVLPLHNNHQLTTMAHR